MPEQKVGRETVLDAALGLLRERGETALSARTVAERAGCSVQPIYSLFGDMRGLVRALYDHARAWVAAYNREHVDDGRNAFEANGLSHLRLARTERHLFQFPVPISAHGGDELRGSVRERGRRRRAANASRSWGICRPRRRARCTCT